MDENFPWWTTKQKPYFCDLVASNQIWPMIIEKAWAKLHGEYSRLWGGDTGLAFRVITGAPTVAYGLTKYRKDPRKVRIYLRGERSVGDFILAPVERTHV